MTKGQRESVIKIDEVAGGFSLSKGFTFVPATKPFEVSGGGSKPAAFKTLPEAQRYAAQESKRLGGIAIKDHAEENKKWRR